MPDTIMQSDALLFRNRSAGIAKLAAALAAAQKNFAPIPKDREVTVTTNTGGTYKFKYATLDGILASTMPALSEQGLAISQALTTWGDNYAVETTLYHSSDEWISNVTPMFVSGRRTREGKELPPGNQELGSAQTYARRYGVSALLCITADEDDDSNHADGHHAEGSQRTAYKPAAGSAGGGGQFRPQRRAPTAGGPTNDWVGDAKRDGVLDETRPKGTLPAKAATNKGATSAEARLAKLKTATDKRIDALKSVSGWTRPTLDQFWQDNSEWIEWMSDPQNGALNEYERFSVAFADAETNMRPVELA